MIKYVGRPKPYPVILNNCGILILISLHIPGDLILKLTEVLLHPHIKCAQLLPDILC